MTESESSFDFDLPDESQFLESSIRLTRDDMRSPESDNTKHDSDSDTDHILSRDDIMPNSTRKYDSIRVSLHLISVVLKYLLA